MNESAMQVGFIGVGSMGGMLVRALLRAKALSQENVWAANRSLPKLDKLAADYPAIHTVTTREVAAHCDLIFLCVGASDTAAALKQMDAELSSEQLLLTTAAVIPLKALEARVPCRVAKLIPSVTQEIGAGIALFMYGSRITTGDRDRLERLLGHISQTVAISESSARPAIGLTSGGPALLAYVLQSMADEAVRNNPDLSPEVASKLVQQTASATMKLMNEAKMSTRQIIQRVAVPGGMTALAIEILSHYLPKAWRNVFQETTRREKTARESIVL